MKELMKLAHKIAKATKALHSEFSYSECLKHGLKIAWRIVRRIDKTGEVYRILLTNADLDAVECIQFITNASALGIAYIDTPSADGGQFYYSFKLGFAMGFSSDCLVTFAKHVRVTIGRNERGLFIRTHKGFFSHRSEEFINRYFCCWWHGRHVYYPDKYYDIGDNIKMVYNALLNRGFDVIVDKGVKI